MVVSNSSCCRAGTSSGGILQSSKHASNSLEYPQCQVGVQTRPSAHCCNLSFLAQLVPSFRATCAIATMVIGWKHFLLSQPAGVRQTHSLHNRIVSVNVTYGITKQTAPRYCSEPGLTISCLIISCVNSSKAVGSSSFHNARLPVHTDIVLVWHTFSSCFSSTTNCPLCE